METKSPFFSIVIPTFNRAHVIEKSIQSVINQSFNDWELIVIDDGSKDNTAAVIGKFENDKISYIYQKNTERSQARNNGIARARGEYICFLDSDDEYCAHHLNSFYNFIKANASPRGIIFSNPLVIHNGNESKEAVAKFNDKDPLAYILKNSIIPDRVCIHHEVFKLYQFNPKIHIGEDTILWAQITNTFPIWHLDEFTVKYVIHEENSVNLKNNVYRNRLNGLLVLFDEDEIKKRLSAKLKMQIISVCYYGIARHFELKRSFFKMTFNAVMSILYDLSSPLNKAKLYMIYSYFKGKSAVK
jgi:glycosyltransferase involved in cell wall biosynthesis